jgi:hypothetical protein
VVLKIAGGRGSYKDNREKIDVMNNDLNEWNKNQLISLTIFY